MADHFLVLFPVSPWWAPASLPALANALTMLGFLGTERGPGLYSTGPQYPGFITYLGCSPQLTLGEQEQATTIGLRGIYPSARFLHGANLKPPRCPRCRKTLEYTADLQAGDASLQCPHCGHAAPLPEYDWRRSAAYGRVFIEISDVYESEAVPGEHLADCLKQATGVAWDYGYVRREDR
jgi:hypothetical protein